MHPLRWKSRYQTGDTETDRRNRKFVDCFNSLIKAAGKREHCQEMEELIDHFSAQAEQFLHNHPNDSDLGIALGRQLIAKLPLSVYGSTSCRECGLCDMSQQKIAEHLKPPAECLFKQL